MIRVGFLFIVSFLLLVYPNCAYTQIALNTDSLQTQLQNSTGEQRAEVLLELSSELRRSNIDSAITYARRAHAVSQRIKNEPLKAESSRNLGWLLSTNGENPEALKHLLQAKKMFEQIGNLHSEAVALKHLGYLYKSQSEYDRALEYYFSALNLEEQLNDKQRIADILLSIGLIFNQMQQSEKSIAYYKRGLKISEQMNDINNIAMNATNLGVAYTDMGKSEQALEAYHKALEAAEKLPGAHAKAMILMNMSAHYKSTNAYQQALEANNEALALARDMSDKMLESLALKNIASVYRRQGNFFDANKYLFQTLPLLDRIGFRQNIIENQNQIARNYFNIGEFDKTIDHALPALKAAWKVKAYKKGVKSLRLLSEVYQQTGDYEEAIAAQKDLIALKDSSSGREQSRQIAEMQTRYETEQKEQEITLLQKEQEKAELIRNAFIAGLVLILIIGFLVYNRQRLKIKKNRTDLENTQLKEQQLKQDIEFKNKQLTTHSLNLVQKNEVMKDLKQNINDIRKGPKGNVHKELSSLEHLVDYSFNLDEDWEEFKLYFEEVHTGFFETLKSQYPKLTPNELRLSALVKLNLTTKEIATIMGITPDSVKTARYRLRKKLGMETEENLTDFMMNVEKQASNIGYPAENSE